VPPISRLCVFCGSSTGTNPAIGAATVELGRSLAAEGIELVYGGGSIGLMGLLADTVLDAGGRVFGVIPTGLFSREVGHTGLSELAEVGSMHERKALMYERSDAFCALPGGLGTLEELAEITTWAQLGLHAKPIGVLDVDGFYRPLLAFLDRAVDDGLLKAQNRVLLVDRATPSELLEALRRYDVPREPQWLDLDQT
jgi:uncharacterized protein (TIGR00730 family)